MRFSLSKFQCNIAALAVILLIAFGLYGPSLANGFVHDDEGQVVQNPYIKSFAHAPKAFTSCIWEAYADGCEGRTNYYRPLHTLSYIFTYAINSSPAFFHFINIVYYILLVWCVFLLSNTLIGGFGAISTAALFLVYPIHTESVIWIASVPELLYSLFVVLAFWIYLSGFKYKEWWVGGAFFLGLLAKEPAIFIPIVLMAYDCVRRPYNSFQNPLSFLKREGAKYWRFIVCFGVYFLARTVAIGGIGERPDFYDFSALQRIYSSIFVFGEYIKKTIWPMELNPFIPFEPISSAGDARFLINFAITLLFAGLFIFAVIKKEKILILGMAIFFLFLSPVIIFVNSVAENVIAERYLLLPSLGAVLIAGYYITHLFEKRSATMRWIVPAIFFAVFSGFSIPKIYAQHSVWKSSKSLYEYSYNLNARQGDVIDVTSSYDLAIVYEGEGRINEAKVLYEKVMNSGEGKKKIPSVAKAYNNLGKIYLGEKDYGKAISLFGESIAINPKHAGAYSNMGVAYASYGQLVSAAESFIKSLQIDPKFEGSLKNIRALFSNTGKLEGYNADGSYGALHSFVSELIKNQVWLDWQYNKIEEKDALYVVSSSRSEDGALNARIKINSSYNMTLFPMIFYAANGELYFRPKLSGEFDQEKGELSLHIPAHTKKRTSDMNLELYIVLEDFKYYKFEL